MDNAIINKNYTMIASSGALCLLGITRKVKLSYLLVGHTHTMDDGVMGSVGTVLCDSNMQTFEVMRERLIAEGERQGFGHVEMFRIVGCTDYNKLFDDIRNNPRQIYGKPPNNSKLYY